MQQEPTAEFIRIALENKKRLNSLLDQLLAIEKRRKQQDIQEPGEVQMVAACTNTDLELIVPLFEQYRKDRGEKILVESYAQTVAIKLNTLIQEAREDEKLWNEVELVSQQQIVLAANNYTDVEMISNREPITVWQQQTSSDGLARSYTPIARGLESIHHPPRYDTMEAHENNLLD